MHKRIFATLSALLITGLAAAASAPPEPAAASRPAIAETHEIQLRDFPRTARYPGVIKSLADLSLRSRVTGRIERIQVEYGQRVTQGDLLVELDSNLLDEAVSQAQGQHDAAEAQLRQARADLDRARTLFDEGAISRMAFDRYQSAYQSAEGQFASARAALASAREQRSYARMRAPMDAIVGKRHADPGDLMQPGMPVLELRAQGNLVVEFQFPQSLALGEQSPVEVRGISGRIAGITPDVRNGTRTARAALSQTQDLLPGMLVPVEVTLGTQAAPAVPLEALLHRGQLVQVYRIGQRGPALAILRIGQRQDGYAEVLSGLNSGDIVGTPAGH